jgi:hypothetical protein
MVISQNVRFCGTALPGEDFEHPTGASIATFLSTHLMERGWRALELENWRDVGWIFVCSSDKAELDVVLAEMATRSHWMAQISPTYVPGLIGWTRKKKPSASPADILRLAIDVHQILSAQGGYSQFMWCWDGYPDEDRSTPTPVAAKG